MELPLWMIKFLLHSITQYFWKKPPANSITLPIKLASGLQISKLKIYENYLPWSSGITVLYWISVMFVKLISSIPWSVFSDTKFSNDLNSRLGGKLASRNTITIFLKKKLQKTTGLLWPLLSPSNSLKYNFH